MLSELANSQRQMVEVPVEAQIFVALNLIANSRCSTNRAQLSSQDFPLISISSCTASSLLFHLDNRAELVDVPLCFGRYHRVCSVELDRLLLSVSVVAAAILVN